MIVESIVTSVSASGEVNVAPMGVEWGDAIITLKPFVDTTTYRNVHATGSAVVNLIDDVRLFAEAAIANPAYEVVAATTIQGRVLADCCSWRELRTRSLVPTSPRARIEMEVVHRGFNREFIGFNRARHAVLEMAIYATRLHLLEAAFVDAEFDRLRTIVEKTAGPAEHAAMNTLLTFVAQSRRRVTARTPDASSR